MKNYNVLISSCNKNVKSKEVINSETIKENITIIIQNPIVIDAIDITVPNFSETSKSSKIEFSQGSILDKKIKEHFTNEELIFDVSFYEYLNYNPNKDFVMNLDNVCELIGYSEKSGAKCVLLKAKCLKENRDYIIQNSINSSINQDLWNVNNKETILLTINAFKKFCIIVGTDQSYEVHEYYNKLEQCLFEARKEEFEKNRNKIIDGIIHRELILIKSFHLKHVLYLIRISIDVIKFGFSSNIQRRLYEHKQQISDEVTLEFCIETMYNIELEKEIKKELNLMKLVEDKLKSRIFSNKYKGKKQTELIKLDSEFTLSNLINLIVELKETINKDEVIQFQNKMISKYLTVSL
jgi:predicted GIY-YIG superfamily endonuclease